MPDASPSWYVVAHLESARLPIVSSYPIAAPTAEDAADRAAVALVPGCDEPYRLTVRVWESSGPLCALLRYWIRPDGAELVAEDRERLHRWGILRPAEA